MAQFTLTNQKDQFTGVSGETNTFFAAPFSTLQIGGVSADVLTGGNVGASSPQDIIQLTAGNGAALTFQGDGNITHIDRLNLSDLGNVVQFEHAFIRDNADGGTFFVVGGAGNDVVDGSGVDNVVAAGKSLNIEGGGGDDFLKGGLNDDTLSGGTGNDTLQGGGGNDTLSGDDGADTMSGGVGSDTYFVDNTADQVIENVGEGTDTVVASINFTQPANVEALVLNGSAVVATGNGAGNFIYGNALANFLNGAGGADMMFGGAGDDVYAVENPGDQVIENPGEGFDTVISEINYTLGANVEALALSGSAVMGTGNADGNLLFGNDQENILDGAGGADDMRGRTGNDTYRVDNVGDQVIENFGEGTDTIISSASYVLPPNVEILQLSGGAITANGNDADNMIIGNALDNILNGGDGSDFLVGGAGRDTFVFREPGSLVAPNRDRVSDFNLNNDILAFDTHLFANAQDVLAHATDFSVNSVIIHDGDSFVTGNPSSPPILVNETHSIIVGGLTFAQLQAHAADLLVFI